MVLSFFSTVLH